MDVPGACRRRLMFVCDESGPSARASKLRVARVGLAVCRSARSSKAGRSPAYSRPKYSGLQPPANVCDYRPQHNTHRPPAVPCSRPNLPDEASELVQQTSSLRDISIPCWPRGLATFSHDACRVMQGLHPQCDRCQPNSPSDDLTWLQHVHCRRAVRRETHPTAWPRLRGPWPAAGGKHPHVSHVVVRRTYGRDAIGRHHLPRRCRYKPSE